MAKASTKAQHFEIELELHGRYRLWTVFGLASPEKGREGIPRLTRALEALDPKDEFSLPPGTDDDERIEHAQDLDARMRDGESGWFRFSFENIETILDGVDAVVKDKNIQGPAIRAASLRYINEPLEALAAAKGREKHARVHPISPVAEVPAAPALPAADEAQPAAETTPAADTSGEQAA